MKAVLIPFLMCTVGVAGGGGAAYYLQPPVEEQATEVAHEPKPEQDADHSEKSEDSAEETAAEYVKLNNQFVVPVVSGDLVKALVVMSLSIEITQGETSAIYAVEPKLRDAFLQVLFDHANMGGFQGEFTEARNMDVLRTALTDSAQTIVGGVVTGVLITDIARQDI
ncbi:flagellar basal body-associated FliL family protein [Roseovarius phycicola]|uniref:Flagellar basal body-associated FliL family protein n=1 Tax=Roseovarius phycicola TaxID=3080976 RepID=A0ABZ2HMF2_9RHOB